MFTFYKKIKMDDMLDVEVDNIEKEVKFL